MTENPFGEMKFHGVFSRDALHHNTLDNIKKAVGIIHDRLESNRLFLVNLMSIKSGSYGKGT
ncbi:hypothetical protein SAMN05444373_105512 [Thermoclostridium caenicola]|uniref:Uncharacterized protein n=1 Tax=Thermoclostridium caenicola TaxID=659425 RepID=A0A1M6JCN2_9FIRM|nr:hypothetical protein SAMN05444373_105512 [Thermoclostridium caenicola]